MAAVANLNLAVANVALPSIALEFDSGQTALNLIAVGYSLGLAASVLFIFGAVGDRYGRKLMLILGMALSVPACLLAAWAPTEEVLFAARVLGGEPRRRERRAARHRRRRSTRRRPTLNLVAVGYSLGLAARCSSSARSATATAAS